jgi:5'-phosphate synthase pdxT subunit
MRVGVLALQGAFAEHIAVLNQLDTEAVPVRLPGQLAGLDGLVIPGGESTTITKLMLSYDFRDEISRLAAAGLPVFGTCAGLVLLAREIVGNSFQPVAAMAISVRRNAFGRQLESFESDIAIPVLGETPFPGVFIRAPSVERADDGVEVIARLPDETMVAVRQGKLIACAFHPELSDDRRFHEYFLDIVAGRR